MSVVGPRERAPAKPEHDFQRRTGGRFVDKASQRIHLRTLRAGLGKLRRAQEEDVVNAAVLSDEDWAAADVVAVYRAMGSELSLVSATNAAWRDGKRVCFPKVQPGGLSLHEVRSWSELEAPVRGLSEPGAGCPVVSPASVDLLVAPGIGWTSRGDRLGQGGGHYDRLLPLIGGVTWGVGFDCQLVDVLPTEAHDRPVDRVIVPALVS